MSKSIIYAVNSSAQTVSVDGTINPGIVIRRFGPNLNLVGTGIQITGPGYYDIDTSFTLIPETAGEVTITAYLDGVSIPGGTATATAAEAGDYVNLAITSVVKEGCGCCTGLKTLTFILTGLEANVVNSAILVEKL